MTGLVFDPKQTTIYLWSNIFIPLNDQKAITAALREIHEDANYRAYNPFPGGTGTPANVSSLVRLFVARPENGWTRVIGQANMDLLPILAEKLKTSILYVWISDTDCGILVFGDKDLAPYLQTGKTEEDLSRAFRSLKTATLELKKADDTPLQGEIADLASQYGVNDQQASKLINKTVGQLFKKMGSDSQQDAMSMVSQQSQQAQREAELIKRINLVMSCLTVPSNWQEPSFRDLAAAYQIACQLEQNENALLLPGDEAILDRVEYPLDYHMAYYAR